VNIIIIMVDNVIENSDRVADCIDYLRDQIAKVSY
jgi:hypothetical protein